MTRKDARIAGRTFYDGRPCRQGHTRRRTNDKKCIECDAQRKRLERSNDTPLNWNAVRPS